MSRERTPAPYVLHAPTGDAAVDDVVRRATADGDPAVLGVRAVTDTLKSVRMTPTGAVIDETVDRAAVRVAVGPLALAPAAIDVLAQAYGPGWPDQTLPALVVALRGSGMSVLLADVPAARG